MSDNVLFGMDVKGGEELAKALRKIEDKFLDTMAEVLPEEADTLFNASQAAVPRASGTLSSSGVVEKQRSETTSMASVGYNDHKAAAVHEGIHHGRHIEGTTGFKWLERSFNQFVQGAIERIVARLRALIGGD